MAPKTQPWRETPLIESSSLSRVAGCKIFLKLENLQPSGSFKSRGIGHYMLQRMAERLATPVATVPETAYATPSSSGTTTPDNTHFYSSSGGNAGLAAVYAAVALGRPCTVVTPLATKPAVIASMRAAGAHHVVQHGASWKDADTYMRDNLIAKDPGAVYVPPFDHPDIWAGNAGVMDEVAAQLGGVAPTAVVCSVGGGGLLCGVCQSLDRAGWGDVPVLALETKGADSLAQAVAARELVTLPAITSQATTLGAVRVAAGALQCGLRDNVTSVVLEDAEAAMGCWRLAEDERILVELSCGVSAAMCYDGRLDKALGRKLEKNDRVVIIVCGGSATGVDMIQKWREEFGAVDKAAAAETPLANAIAV